MDWFIRNLTRSSSKTKTSNLQSQSNSKGEDEEQLYGITGDLINHVKSLTIDTFRNFPLQDEDETTYGVESPRTSARIRKDLSQWQERHANLILSRVKELSQVRYKLCPGRLKEKQFWSIYFKLVRSHVIE
ncbi:BSD domain containing protein [Senna tora]|uniref:BSD domain containing protein n=1 Tax=Senna tora TaxID=362788 RepID=A0A835CMF8_9FABA|nr:BSD domain containing protein [Senna tora]